MKILATTSVKSERKSVTKMLKIFFKREGQGNANITTKDVTEVGIRTLFALQLDIWGAVGRPCRSRRLGSKTWLGVACSPRVTRTFAAFSYAWAAI